MPSIIKVQLSSLSFPLYMYVCMQRSVGVTLATGQQQNTLPNPNQNLNPRLSSSPPTTAATTTTATTAASIVWSSHWWEQPKAAHDVPYLWLKRREVGVTVGVSATRLSWILCACRCHSSLCSMMMHRHHYDFLYIHFVWGRVWVHSGYGLRSVVRYVRHI